MARQPPVTVLITAYNSNPAYLNKAVKSAIDQDYSNLEVLVIDDGSKSRLYQFLDNKEDLKLKYEHISHCGFPNVLIKGIKKAKGKYIAILDSDDILSEKSISRRVEHIRSEKVGLVYGHLDLIDKKGDSYATFYSKSYSNVDDFVQAIVSNHCAPLQHVGIMFDRNAVLKVGNYDSSLIAFNDFDLSIRVAKETGASQIPHIVASHREHENNMTQSFESYKRGLQGRASLLRMYNRHPKLNLYLMSKFIITDTAKYILRKKKLSILKNLKLLDTTAPSFARFLGEVFHTKKKLAGHYARQEIQ